MTCAALIRAPTGLHMPALSKWSMASGIALCSLSALLTLRGRPGQSQTGPSPMPQPHFSNPRHSAPQVDLHALQTNPGQLERPARDPFRFYVRSATAPLTQARPEVRLPTPEPPRPVRPPKPPIPWSLMAIVQRGTMNIAVFSDCRGLPVAVKEGALLVGQWQVTTVGVESTVLQSFDGTSSVVPLRGCPPR